MKIGCVKEIKNNEFRVGLTPDNVRAYVQKQGTLFTWKKALARAPVLRMMTILRLVPY